MLKYFLKRNNYNRIKKLIGKKPIRFEGTFEKDPFLVKNKYICETTSIIFLCCVNSNFKEIYIIEEKNKEINLTQSEIKKLYELAQEKFRKPY